METYTNLYRDCSVMVRPFTETAPAEENYFCRTLSCRGLCICWTLYCREYYFLSDTVLQKIIILLDAVLQRGWTPLWEVFVANYQTCTQQYLIDTGHRPTRLLLTTPFHSLFYATTPDFKLESPKKQQVSILH